MAKDKGKRGWEKTWIVAVLFVFSSFFRAEANASPHRPTTRVSPTAVLNTNDGARASWGFVWGKHLDATGVEKAVAAQSFSSLDKPCLWNELPEAYPEEGYGTFFTYLLIPQALRGQQIGLYLPKCHTACRAFIGEQLLTQAGEPARNRSEFEPAFVPRRASFTATDSLVYLIIHVANFDYAAGGIVEPIYIGPKEKVDQTALNHLAGAAGIALALLIAAFFYSGIFFFIKKDRALLYFGLFCLAQSARILFSEEYPYFALFGALDWEVVIRMEYASMVLSIIFFSQLVHAIFPNQTHTKVVRFFQWISALYLGMILFTPPHFFSSWNKLFIWIICGLALYGVWIFIRAFHQGETGSRLALLSLGILMTLFLLQIAEFHRFISYDPMWNYAFYGLFILTQSLLLSQRIGEYIRELGQQAMQSVEAKNNFLTAISHELRTPMNGVLGMTTLLEQTDLSPEQQRYVQAIRHSGENMVVLLDDLLEFSQLCRRRVELESVAFRLDKIIEDVLSLYTEQIRSKDLFVHMRLSPGTPRKWYGDAARIKHVLNHLLSNALKFTEKGEVRISARVARWINKEKAVLLIEVRDTGIGIAQEKLEKVFEPFFQANAGLTRKYEGTGLGLPIAKRVVEAMGGSIKVSSSPHTGTTFKVELPLRVREQAHTPPASTEGRKAIIFSENPEFIKSIELELQHLGVQIVQTIDEGDTDVVIFAGERWSVKNEAQIKAWLEKGHTVVQWSYGTRRSPFPILHLVNPLTPSAIKEAFEQVEQSQEAARSSEVTDLDAPRLHTEISILIAEDNQVNQKLAMMLLKKLGFHPDAVANGREVLEALSRKNYDLILMDLQMPEMDGLTATRIIRGDEQIADQPVIIALTANALPEDEARCREIGMEDFLAKPLRPGILEEKLKYWSTLIYKKKYQDTRAAAS